jgi:hypothetical protein
MSATVSQLKAGLKTRLATISGLRTYDYQPDQITHPMAWSILDSVDYHGAMGPGLVTHNFRVAVIVGRASERSAESRLNAYLSYDNGVRAAIEADKTLGGIAQSLNVAGASNISSIDASDGTYLYIEFRVAVYV